jgi:hypothetical protein
VSSSLLQGERIEASSYAHNNAAALLKRKSFSIRQAKLYDQ